MSQIKARLHHFYSLHNPSKLASIDDILEKYNGREDELFLRLDRKYNPVLSSAFVNQSNQQNQHSTSNEGHVSDVSENDSDFYDPDTDEEFPKDHQDRYRRHHRYRGNNAQRRMRRYRGMQCRCCTTMKDTVAWYSILAFLSFGLVGLIFWTLHYYGQHLSNGCMTYWKPWLLYAGCYMVAIQIDEQLKIMKYFAQLKIVKNIQARIQDTSTSCQKTVKFVAGCVIMFMIAMLFMPILVIVGLLFSVFVVPLLVPFSYFILLEESWWQLRSKKLLPSASICLCVSWAFHFCTMSFFTRLLTMHGVEWWWGDNGSDNGSDGQWTTMLLPLLITNACVVGTCLCLIPLVFGGWVEWDYERKKRC